MLSNHQRASAEEPLPTCTCMQPHCSILPVHTCLQPPPPHCCCTCMHKPSHPTTNSARVWTSPPYCHWHRHAHRPCNHYPATPAYMSMWTTSHHHSATLLPPARVCTWTTTALVPHHYQHAHASADPTANTPIKSLCQHLSSECCCWQTGNTSAQQV